MQLTHPKVELMPQIHNEAEMFEAIETAGRICYASEPKEGVTSEDFVNRLISRNHLSPLEFGTVYLILNTLGCMNWIKFFQSNPFSKVLVCGTKAFITTNYRVLVENDLAFMSKWAVSPTSNHVYRLSAKFTCSLRTARDFNRHRANGLAECDESIAEQSTRFCNYASDKFNKEVSFVIPPHIELMEGAYSLEDHELNETYHWLCRHDDKVEHLIYSYNQDATICRFLDDCSESEWDYLQSIEQEEEQPQNAAYLLNLATKTVSMHCAFESDWVHFFELRCAKNAHPEAQLLAKELNVLMQKELGDYIAIG